MTRGGAYYQPKLDVSDGSWAACYPTPAHEGCWTPLVAGFPTEREAQAECDRLARQLQESHRALRQQRKLEGVRP